MNKRRVLFIAFVISITIIAILICWKSDFQRKNQRVEVGLIEKELDIVYGSESAQLTIFLFSSYSCSFCRKFFENVYPELKNNYIDKGIVRLIVKPVALTNNESVINSLKIAVCINRYGNFDNLNKLLLIEPKVVYTEEFKDVVDELVQKDLFVAECMLGGESENYIKKNAIDFKRLKCTGTPTFVINNKIYKGYLEYDKFIKIVERELAYTL